MTDVHLSSSLPAANNTSSQITLQDAIEAAKTWLSECQTHHESCRKIPHFSRMVDHGTTHQVMVDVDHETAMPKRLLHFSPSTQESTDTTRVRVVRISSPVEYAALSHRWGASETCKLTKANMHALEEDGISVTQLPRTFKEAVEVTRGLGMQYLWIDSLCIEQGRNEEGMTPTAATMFPNHDFQYEAPRMGCIYGNAIATIAAMDGPDSESGLFPDRATGEGEVDSLSTRAWVVQERMVTPRSMLFTNGEVRWECREADASLQARHLQPRARDMTLENPKDLFAFFHDWNPPAEPPQDDQHMVLMMDIDCLRGEAEDYVPFMKVWWKFISEYTTCRLSHEGDRFLAMSGVANTARRRMHLPNFFGVWDNFWMQDLTWYVDREGPASRRPERFLAPSWSWPSVKDGRVRNSYWERDGEPAVLWIKPWVKLPYTTSFDMPLPWQPWSALSCLSIALKGTLREGTVSTMLGADDKPQFTFDLDPKGRWSDEEEHQFWPDSPDEFPPGSIVAIGVLHMWHYPPPRDGNGPPLFRDIRLVLKKLTHLRTDRPALATENDKSRNEKTGRCMGTGSIHFEAPHYSPKHVQGEVWQHQFVWNEADALDDDYEDFANQRTFERVGYLETTYGRERDYDVVREESVWRLARIV